ncbi:MAG: hypothetical protein GX442_07510 [Candidatus Riflebacteria bacterium]|nr:hypothetical protein [Candidatus Riflebacteria bacterium]
MVRHPERGAAGLIVVIIVLGFMMAIATSFSLLVQTETVGANVSQKFLRARAAALAGVGYVVAQMEATESTFIDYKERLIYLRASLTPDLNARLGGAGVGGSPYTGYKALVTTQWFYASATVNPIPDEVASSMMFKVTTYPNGTDDNSCYVKSIGRYLEIDVENPAVVNATWSAEVIARLNLDPIGKTITIGFWRPLPVEPCVNTTDAFFSLSQRP